MALSRGRSKPKRRKAHSTSWSAERRPSVWSPSIQGHQTAREVLVGVAPCSTVSLPGGIYGCMYDGCDAPGCVRKPTLFFSAAVFAPDATETPIAQTTPDHC